MTTEPFDLVSNFDNALGLNRILSPARQMFRMDLTEAQNLLAISSSPYDALGLKGSWTSPDCHIRLGRWRHPTSLYPISSRHTYISLSTSPSIPLRWPPLPRTRCCSVCFHPYSFSARRFEPDGVGMPGILGLAIDHFPELLVEVVRREY